MAIILENALLADIYLPRVEPGALRIADGRITDRGSRVPREIQDEIIDCAGAVVLPGLVNGHTHLYSALAVGMPPPPQPPQSFAEILRLIWWRLDRAHDAESIEVSARAGALIALRCGTTTLIDHHASPNHIAGSLDRIEKGLADVGLRGILCYETTDRHGPAGSAAGIEENRRYLGKCLDRPDHHFAALVGAHACFTLESETLDQLAALAAGFDTGVHMHVAEDPCDEEACLNQHQTELIDWLSGHRLPQPGSIFVHGTHLPPEWVTRFGAQGATIAHCPRSNMCNGVGYAPVAAFRCPVMLGTDGHGSDMFAEVRAAWYIARHEQAPLTPGDILAMLAESAHRASAALDVPLGKLEPDAAADVVITDYRPATPVTTENLADHFLSGLDARCVTDVLIDGRWALRQRRVETLDEPQNRDHAQRIAEQLWSRMNKIPP